MTDNKKCDVRWSLIERDGCDESPSFSINEFRGKSSGCDPEQTFRIFFLRTYGRMNGQVTEICQLARQNDGEFNEILNEKQIIHNDSHKFNMESMVEYQQKQALASVRRIAGEITNAEWEAIANDG